MLEYNGFIICSDNLSIGVWFNDSGWQDFPPIGHHSSIDAACRWIDGMNEKKGGQK